ncbi:Aldehyde oxidase and xanthine dehydrogenase molybdopterin binding (plasmid) [Neorhizobium galegae bv. officinalis bv. officinalis str. HAMBI 1141]|uniref:Aldehyde oxidase and xanthine dehydrogenase molybdopterin binding n=1 Tax=Neorhizobium galegae bv. officinalis bv. officinalis str. HAMBI 1141 TaxID=1028801 RepID=A0A068TID0_NEOGA|nr:xanthine dehydrogenase family protein molybdopterin-binding subunit [Neorhizobium galegae]CDN57839.1 Aldehyde oxidase and xanthine dehydrogenase molybdopterin binding [Neorhizobium galegae bv. officinalis bv. officinalis str. HAMBI 1141]
MLNETKVVGLPLSRIDGPLKVSGSAKYAADHGGHGMLHGYAVPATVATGRIVDIETGLAERFPGVIKIYTHENRPRAAEDDDKWKDAVALPGHPFRPLENDRILYDGQPIAMVVAESFEAARDAASLVRVRYIAEQPHTDLGREQTRSYVPPQPRREEFVPPEPRGDPQGAFADAPFKISSEYRLEGEYHNPMELFASTVLWEKDGFLTVHDKTQGSQNSRDYICNVFELDPEKVTVKNSFVGGAFGSGLRPKHQLFLAVMAALDLKQSVKVEMSRREMFYLTWRPATVQTVSLAADREGRLLSVMHHALQATSRYEDYQENVVNWSGLAYRCDNVRLSYGLAELDVSTPGDMRAPGAATGVTALEMAMDELAYEVGIDPVELRLRNFATRDQNRDKQFTSKALDACYREGAARFGWNSRSFAPRSMRDGNDLVGWGMATGIWEATIMPAEAKVRLSADGKAAVSAAASDIGTGTYTVLGQVAAEALGVPLDDVTVLIGDSSLPKTGVEGGSWTAASSGSAVQAASDAVRNTLLKHAKSMPNSPFGQASQDEVTLAEGRLVLDRNHQVGVSIGDIMDAAGVSFIEEHGKVAPDQEQAKKFISYTHSAVFVEVKVDEELGVPRVTRVVSAVAGGRVLNPKTARSQILGGVVMGIGMALHEEGMVDHRTGRIMNHNMAEYHMPAHADVEDIEVIFVHEEDDKVSPIGAKGLGEIGIIGVAAAVSNAIFHATGKRIRYFPMTIDKILETSEEVRRSA